MACFVNSCRISHLDMKPESGGRPASDRRVREASATRVGALAHAVDSVFRLEAALAFIVKKAEVVIII